ncbi:MAG: hypothetical protein ACLPYS_04310 [Vulcanimicrobiaceae bacterium]
MTKEIAEKWVGRTIWQIHADETPVWYEFIGVVKAHDVPSGGPVRHRLHLLQAESLPPSSWWDASAPSFLSREAALEYTLTQEDRARLETIERAAFARRGFGCAPGDRPRREPIELDLFTFAAEEAALRTGRPVSQERMRLFRPDATGNEVESARSE